ncbi:MAG TPA: AAA family ATPase [Candidatus Dormibacteraeota bacterium]|nr:AAA family ATPase [Candidatus Dormibacteraeota bacterium]
MLLQFYQLAEQPFGVTPDPRFLYASPTHREAIASVLYSVRAGRGFTALIAEPGMGKTTLLFNLLQQLGHTAKTAFLFQAQDTPRNFLRNLLSDLGVEDDGQDLVRMQTKLNECLVRETSQGKIFIVVIDEAQNLEAPVLEVVRMLSNFETSRDKLMHVILAGQPQLAAKLAQPELTQLRQRISVVARLQPFNAEETRGFIEHRLRVAGYRAAEPLFTDRAFAMIAEHSGGLPRNINNICFNAMSIGCALKRKTINAAVIEEVLSDLDLKPLTERVQVPEFSAGATKVTDEPEAPEPPKSRLPKSWKWRVGVASMFALLAGIGWTVLAKNPHISSSGDAADVQGTEMATTQKSLADGATNADLAHQTSGNARTDSSNKRPGGEPPNNKIATDSTLVRVGSHDTLYQICMDRLGRYDDEIIRLLRDLNPGLDNPRQLHVGQEVRIPTAGSLSAKANISPQSNGTTSAVETKKP